MAQETTPDRLAPPAGQPVSRRSVLKIGGLGLAGVAGTSLLSSCGRGSDPHQVIVQVAQSPTAPAGQRRILDLMRRKFEAAYPGASAKFNVVTLGSAVTTSVITAATSRDGPDIFEVSPQTLPTGQAVGVFEVLSDSDWAAVGGKDRYLPSALAACGRSTTELVAIPYYASTMAMYYNRKKFQEAGITAAPTTWTDFVDVGRQLSAPEQDRYAVGMGAAEASEPWHVIWLLAAQLGGQLISPDGTRSQLNSPEVFEATTFWLDWIAKYRIAGKRDATNVSAEQVKQFTSGRTAMFACGFTQAISSMAGTSVAGDWALAGNPTVPYGRPALPAGTRPVQSYFGGATWAISKYSSKRELALGLARMMGDPDVQRLTWQEVGGLPITTETFTAHPETRQGVWKTIYDSATNAAPTPWSPSFAQVSPLLSTAVKPSFAELAAGGTYDPGALKARLVTANQALTTALESERR
ncbi:extracellular solute-binding protein [Amycolatopsis acidiphila]|nr:extracellular solute-binding protein [Amycolatopsis acidiphila]UIJ62477.1 extracellular solute-binding protein [Amycolatopsis acidiphila]GHG83865.1 bicyclomycin resistance protein [Amycolatopsis acidiphila]